MLGVFRGPEAETVVVLAGENQAFHPCVVCRADDLFSIEVSRVEYGGRFIAVALLFVGEGIGREVYEAVELHLMPPQLALRRHRSVRRRIAGAFYWRSPCRSRCTQQEEKHQFGIWNFEFRISGDPHRAILD